MTNLERFSIAWCDCTNPNGERIRFHAVAPLTESARGHLAHIHRKITSDLLREIGNKGGPWGWTIGPLRITEHDLSRYALMYAPGEPNPEIDNVLNWIEADAD